MKKYLLAAALFSSATGLVLADTPPISSSTPIEVKGLTVSNWIPVSQSLTEALLPSLNKSRPVFVKITDKSPFQHVLHDAVVSYLTEKSFQVSAKEDPLAQVITYEGVPIAHPFVETHSSPFGTKHTWESEKSGTTVISITVTVQDMNLVKKSLTNLFYYDKADGTLIGTDLDQDTNTSKSFKLTNK